MPSIDLNDVAAFIHVVDAGGFSAAARRLKVPKSTVSRQVSRLESGLGVRLLQRTTRSVAMTEVARAYHAQASTALAALYEATDAAADQHDHPKGTVRVTAPTDVGAEVLPSLVAKFARLYPEVRVEVELSSRAPDLVGGGYDLGVRAGRPRDPALVVRRLQRVRFRLYAAPAYLRRAPAPRRLADLAAHECVLFRPTRGACLWRLRRAGEPLEVVVTGRVASDDMSFVRRACVEGSGVAFMPDLVGDDLVARGVLASVLPDHEAAGPSLYLLLPSTRHVPLKVRVLRDFLLEHFPQSK